MTRRQFLELAATAGATVPFSGLSRNAAPSLRQKAARPATRPSETAPQIRLLLHEPDGGPLETERLHTLLARDLHNDPLPQAISAAAGRARVTLASEPLQFAVQLKVPGFGEVFCYADNVGAGYTRPTTIEFVVEAAASRLTAVRRAAEAPEYSGVPRDPEFDKHLEAAARLLPKKPSPGQIPSAYESLSHSLHAGERLTLNAARYRISKLNGPRTEFLFGGLTSGWQRGAEFEKPFTALFNYGVLSWYSWSRNPDPVAQRVNYSRMDKSLEWCVSHKITPKGFGYVYLAKGATPEWLRSWPYEKVLPEYQRVVAQTARRYSDKIPYLEVINEAHDKSNLFHFSQAQILELTREACRAARDGSPTIKRLINNCCLWAEYARRPNADGSRRWSPYRYLSDCVANGAEFERVGLQLYYPQQDLFEIDRMLNRFKTLKRPLQITELSCNSAEGLDPASMRPKSLVPGWHGPWTETMQADWLEAIYTICYSKPEFEAVGYWDLADVGGHFWPNGGLLRKDFSPKESYQRLLNLKTSWGFK